MKLLVMQFSPIPCHILFLRPKYLLPHSILKQHSIFYNRGQRLR